MSETLTTLPSAGSLYLKAALSVTRKPGNEPVIPANSVDMKGLRFDAAHVSAYNEVCGLPVECLALTYPQVLAAPLHIHVLTQPNYPYPVMGMVHLRNAIEQLAPMSIGVAYDVEVRIGNSKKTGLGVEVDLITQYSAAGEVVWTATTTVLHRVKSKIRGKKAPPLPAPAVTAHYQPFEVPEDIGRRYAPVAGDHNPIHLYALTAKMFGFDRAIAHGMWSVARCLGLLLPALEGVPARLSVQFKQPLLLPGKVTLKHWEATDGIAFDLLAREGGKTHLSGQLLK